MKRSPLQRRSKPLSRGSGLKAKPRPRLGVRKCKQCGEVYRPSYAPQRFCSRECAYLERRTGSMTTCAVCGTDFYRAPRGSIPHKFCSQKCMGLAIRKDRACIICGTKFPVKGSNNRKTCSRVCWSEAGRRAKLGKKNPAYRTGEGESRRRWASQAESACRLCGSTTRLQLHHVVYEQHVRAKHGDIYEPANSFTICWDCHNRHHRAVDQRIPISSFRPENLKFARELLGAALPIYLIRYYHVPEPEALLAGRPDV